VKKNALLIWSRLDGQMDLFALHVMPLAKRNGLKQGHESFGADNATPKYRSLREP
jgi:hypothetical protein